MRNLIGILMLALVTDLSMAQQKSCVIDLPVGLIGTDGSLLQGLTAQDITVRSSKQALPIQAVNYDTTPRRVLLIVDTSRRLVPEIRKATAMMADYLVSNARPQDSFALLTVRGAKRQVRFGQSRQEFVKTIQELVADPKEPVRAPNILDAIMEGLAWFGEPQRGDALLILADHLEEDQEGPLYTSRQVGGNGPMQGVVHNLTGSPEDASKAKFKAVTGAISDHQVRVFGLQVGSVRLNASVTAKVTPDDENLFGIAQGSGGFAVLDSTDSFGSYVLTEERIKGLQHKAWLLYGAISQFYVLRVQPPGPVSHQPWKLELAKDLRNNTRALYPEYFDPCSRQDAH